jgi:hypothetical protein
MPMSPRLLRPRASGATHPEALDWATRATTNGGTFTSNTLAAVSTFCAAIDRESGLRAAILRLNLFCGNSDASLSAVRTPLYRGASLGGTQLGDAMDTNVNFVAGDYQETGSGGGLKGDGSTKYLATGFTYNNISSAASAHMSFSGTALETTTNDKMAMGKFFGQLFTLDITTGTTNRGFRSTAINQVLFAHSGATAEAHLIGTRTSDTATAAYRGGSLAATGGAGASAAVTDGTAIPVFAAVNTSSVIAQHTAGRFRMYSIGNGLTAAQALAFSNAVIAFNTALGRA